MVNIMNTKTSYIFSILLLLACSLTSSSTFAKAGKIHFVHGKVEIVAEDGKFRFARKGDEINQGETIQTSNDSSVQVRMTDGGILAVRPSTRLKIEEYQFSNNDDEDRSFFGLLKGSFRSITGWIGKRNKKSFLVRTPTSTIGIRGSDADMGYDEVKQLTAVRTYTGSHTLSGQDENGNLFTLVTDPGDIGIHVAGSRPALGDFFPFAMPAPNQEGKRNRTEKRKEQRQRVAQRRAQRRPGDNTPLAQQGEGDQDPLNDPSQTGEKPTSPLIGQTGPIGSSPTDPAGVVSKPPKPPITITNVYQAPPGTAAVGADMWQASVAGGTVIQAGNGGLVTGSLGDNVFVNGKGQPVSITDYNPNNNEGLKFYANQANVTSEGGFSVSNANGSVVSVGKWGVWQGNFTVIDKGVTKNTISGFHYAYGTSFTPTTVLKALGASSPAFSYTQIGGTATNEVGALPTDYEVKASGSFDNSTTLGTIKVELVKANFASGSTGWSGTFGTGNISDFISTGLTGAGGCGTCTTASGNSNGRFVGGAAQGALVSLSLSDSTKAITGTAVLQKN